MRSRLYEGGVLRPLKPLPFEENQRLKVRVDDEPAKGRDVFRKKEWSGCGCIGMSMRGSMSRSMRTG